MELNHALRVFRLYYVNFKQDPLQAENKLLTDSERQAIGDIEKVVLECSDLVAAKTQPGLAKAA